MFVSMDVLLLTFTSFLRVTFPLCSLYTPFYHFFTPFSYSLLSKNILFFFYNMCRVTYHFLRLYNRMRQKGGRDPLRKNN
ncbi:hypothetical protein COM33_29900 [Bacillus toyonensis]|nr:hypothetical protein Btoyo_4362 [Bacillus toyonensis BCT-7112]KAB2408051.1 hypothetical protein F8514_15030 [Bacillus toyonensis]PEL63692.1 hypothetical protein CN637_28260 [Bacillus toyonensis]PGD33872.1 hypothetical protein COM33_29900 [Bacillus toyonensis]PGD76114.1 hypothetical protein COM36_27110 [Bacillus toyonensis]